MLRYRPGESAVHGADARLKLGAVAALGVLSAFLSWPGLLVLLGGAIIATSIAGLSVYRILRDAWPILLVTLFAALTRTLLANDALGGTTFFIQVLLAVFLAEGLIVSTSPSQLESVIHRVARRIPGVRGGTVSFLFALTLATIPQLTRYAREAGDALRARGLLPRRLIAYVSAFGQAMILRLVRGSGVRADAAVVRHFNAERTAAPIRCTRRRGPFIAAWLTISALAVVAHVAFLTVA